VAEGRGELLRARELYRSALHLHSVVDAKDGVADCLVGMAHVVSLRADFGRATHLTRQALDMYEALERTDGTARCLMELADVALMYRTSARQSEDPEPLYRRALPAFEKMNDLIGQGACLNGLGTSARFQGELERAERYYRRALECYETAGSPDAHVVRLNMAIMFIPENSMRTRKPSLTRRAGSFHSWDAGPILAVCTRFNWFCLPSTEIGWRTRPTSRMRNACL